MDPNVPPQNFLRTCNNDVTKAEKLWQEHLSWRRVAEIGSIHQRPHPHFHDIKKAYPHFVHGHARNGLPVSYELCGRMNLKPLFREGLQVADMIHHLVYTTEYMINVLKPQLKSKVADGVDYEPEPGGIVIMDVKGLSLSQLSGDLISYLSAAGAMVNANYPGFQKRTIIVNAPMWFSGAWGGVNKFMSKEVRDAACVCGSNYMKELNKSIDLDQIPKEYGGTSVFGMMEHEYERDLRAFVKEVEVEDEEEEEEDMDEDSGFPDSPRRTRSFSFEDDTMRGAKKGGSYGGSRVFYAILLVVLLVLFLLTAFT
ncbi:hypothetical protein TL16_g05341 [Triparma laevis f. inornata]|uniref:CRAL-TRIO domain-containing protein n=1 Tax=Triparma laevis f. inornata TaxID=1714386 RepID=A0A9W7E6J7_9STRA|nr:hypothetical protein TL16_g05341 [Triparma laevis f. inornata]